VSSQLFAPGQVALSRSRGIRSTTAFYTISENDIWAFTVADQRDAVLHRGLSQDRIIGRLPIDDDVENGRYFSSGTQGSIGATPLTNGFPVGTLSIAKSMPSRPPVTPRVWGELHTLLYHDTRPDSSRGTAGDR